MRAFLCCLGFTLCLSAVFVIPTSCTPPATTESTTDGGNTDGTAMTETPTETPTETTFQPLSADGYTTVSDVVSHNKVPGDIGEIEALLGAGSIDWAKVQEMYEKGKNSVKSDGSIRTLNGFASKPDNFKLYSPEAVAFFKDSGICQLAPVGDITCEEGKFVDEFIESYAINGKGPFAQESDKARAAAVRAGLMVLMSYWVRLEFGKAIGKAKDGNYEPLAGAPHNWDEAFAFYWGPEGKHSLYALADKLTTKYQLGSSINKDFFQALIDGLKELTENKEPTDPTAAGNKQLLRLFILGAIDAAKELQDASSEEDKAAARWRGFGYWQAIGHAIHKADADAAKTFADVFFTKQVSMEVLTKVKDAVKAALPGMGFEEADFGTALQ